MDKDERQQTRRKIARLFIANDNDLDVLHAMAIYDSELERAGSFTDNRPTYEDVMELKSPHTFNDLPLPLLSMEQINILADKGMIQQPKREEPDYTEDDVRDLANIMCGEREICEEHWEAADAALAAGYRKCTKGGRDDR